MVLRCLQFVFGGHLPSKESAPWWSGRERTASEPAQLAVWYRLEFRIALPQYKYCWLEPRVGRCRLRFRPDVTDQMLFGNSVLRGLCLQRGRQTQAFFDLTRRLRVAVGWPGRYRNVDQIRDRMVEQMVRICLQQFRIDVLS